MFTKSFNFFYASITLLLVLTTPITTALRFDSDGTGYYDGYFYSFYELNYNQQTYLDTEPNGRFSMQWREDSVNTVGGVGWGTGNPGRTIRFGITQFDVHNGQKQTVAIYGWMRDSPNSLSGIVEYYIVEDHRNWNAADANAYYKGSHTVDNSVYNYYEANRYNSPQAFSSNNVNFKQYWAVRQSTRNSGTVNVGAHFYHWRNFGMPTKSNFGYQILAVEGYRAQGFARGYAEEV